MSASGATGSRPRWPRPSSWRRCRCWCGLFGRYVFPLDPLWLTVATLNAALPAGANVYLVAQMYGVGVARATNAVVISTAASVFTLSIALLLLGVQTR